MNGKKLLLENKTDWVAVKGSCFNENILLQNSNWETLVCKKHTNPAKMWFQKLRKHSKVHHNSITNNNSQRTSRSKSKGRGNQLSPCHPYSLEFEIPWNITAYIVHLATFWSPHQPSITLLIYQDPITYTPVIKEQF